MHKFIRLENVFSVKRKGSITVNRELMTTTNVLLMCFVVSATGARQAVSTVTTQILSSRRVENDVRLQLDIFGHSLRILKHAKFLIKSAKSGCNFFSDFTTTTNSSKVFS